MALRAHALLFFVLALLAITRPASAVPTPEELETTRGKEYLALWDAGNGEELYKHCSEWSKSPASSDDAHCKKPQAEFVATVKRESSQCGPVVTVREEFWRAGGYQRTAVHRDCPGQVVYVHFMFMGQGGDELQGIDTNVFADTGPGSAESDKPMLAIVGGVMLLGLLVMIVVIFVVVRAVESRQSAAWTAAARALGLGLAAPSFTQPMMGTHRGVPVQVFVTQSWERSFITEASQKKYSTVFRAAFPRPLGMGLSLYPKSLLGNLLGFGAGEIHLGHPAFDGTFRLLASNPARVPVLARVAGDFVQAQSAGVVRASDEFVEIARAGKVTDAREIAAALDVVTTLAQRIVAATA